MDVRSCGCAQEKTIAYRAWLIAYLACQTERRWARMSFQSEPKEIYYMSGHSKWANIKHRKGAQDAKRGKIFHKLAKEITVAARVGQSGDPSFNPRLRTAIDAARSQQMPKSNIESAIKRGTGDDDGVQYEEVVYEGYIGKAAVYIEVLTDNKNRTLPEIRTIFNKKGGSIGKTGSVAFMFEKKGFCIILKSAGPEDAILEALIENGAEDYSDNGDHFEVYCAPEDFNGLKDGLETAKIVVEHSEMQMVPTTPVKVEGEQVEKAHAFIEALEEHDDVQNVWTSADFDD